MMTTTTIPEYLDRPTTIALIRKSLKERTGRTWSVTGGRGTAWGWIKVSAPKARLIDGWKMTDEDEAILSDALDLRWVGNTGVSIPASSDYYREYVDRAAGLLPSVVGQPYWD